MSPNRIPAILCLFLLSGAAAYSAECPEIPEDTATKLAQYVHDQFGFAPSSTIKLERSLPAYSDSCSKKLVFVRLDTKAEYTLYLSADQRFLSRDLMDVTLPPNERRKDDAAHLNYDLNSGRFPSVGPESALVTITIFSDFECPYCKREAEILRRELLPANPDIRLAFRNFPLPSHPWARVAAEMAACVYEQDQAAFWDLHDFLFANQAEITTLNLGTAIEAFVGKRGLNLAAYRTCMSEHRSGSQIDRDLAFATSHSLDGTPTIFINGIRYDGVIELQELKGIVRMAGVAAAEAIK